MTTQKRSPRYDKIYFEGMRALDESEDPMREEEEKKDAWTCIRCEKVMDNVMGIIQPHDGTVFLGSPGYGSGLDNDHYELDEVSQYAIVLCDDCLKGNRDKVQGVKLEREKSWIERASIVELEPDRFTQEAKRLLGKDLGWMKANLTAIEDGIANKKTPTLERTELESRAKYIRALLNKVDELGRRREKDET